MINHFLNMILNPTYARKHSTLVAANIDVLKSDVKLAVIALGQDKTNLNQHADVFNKIINLLSEVDNGFEFTFRCYISGCDWVITKDFSGRASVKADEIKDHF